MLQTALERNRVSIVADLCGVLGAAGRVGLRHGNHDERRADVVLLGQLRNLHLDHVLDEHDQVEDEDRAVEDGPSHIIVVDSDDHRRDPEDDGDRERQ